MSKTIDDIRQRHEAQGMAGGLASPKSQEWVDMGLVLAALDEANAKLAVLDLAACAAGRSRDVLRDFAFTLVERELRELELSVCAYDVGEHAYIPVWEGTEEDVRTLLQAVDALKVQP